MRVLAAAPLCAYALVLPQSTTLRKTIAGLMTLLIGLTLATGFPQQALAADTDCIEKGGKAICTAPEIRQYSLLLCYELNPSAAEVNHRWWKECAAWGGKPGDCPVSKLTPNNLVAKGIEFEKLAHHVDSGPGCNISGSSAGWLSPGQTLTSSYCWPGGPTYENGIETSNRMRVNTSGTGKGHGQTVCTAGFAENVMGRRDRTIACPTGYTKRNIAGGKYECFRVEEQECPCCGESCSVGNPVWPGTGKKTQVEIDYEGEGAFPLRLVRSYSSYGWFSSPQETNGKSSTLDGYWRFNYDRRVYPISSSAYVQAMAVRGDGVVKHFSHGGKEVLIRGSARDDLQPETDGSGNVIGWRYTTAANEVESYDASGKLLSITAPDGLTQTLVYSDGTTPPEIAGNPGLLIRVTDAFGNALSFTYDDYDRVAKVTDPAGTVYRFNYVQNQFGALFEVVKTNGTATQKRTYHYENTTFRHALTGITDEQNVRVGTYEYDTGGKAKLTQGVNGLNKYTLAYSAGATVVTDPLNVARTYSYQTVGGVVKNTSVAQPCPDCPGGGNTVTSIAYDARGFVDTRTNANGVVTKFVYDNEGREESRTEAFGTPVERTITTIWHPTLRLPTQVDEAGRRTTYTYTALGKPETQTVKDLATGESRTTTWTYWPNGLLATIDGPRTDVTDVTSYHYDEGSGRLIRVTNALGHVTDITNFDASGRPLRVVDANNVETLFTYDIWGRLKARTVAGATTAMDYDDAGQLTKVTLPDGYFVRYEYDAAHRLTDIWDNLSNHVKYTLDARGNRIKEEVFDSSSTLRRASAQVFDTLSRLKQIKNANGEVVTEFGYDAQGNRTTETQVGSLTTANIPDALNRVAETRDAKNGVTKYGYNALDQLESVQDPNQLITKYTLSAFGNVMRLESPDTGVSTYTYDAAGNRITETNAGNVTVAFTYDALNRIKTRDGGSYDDVTYQYDGTNYAGSVPYGVGRLTGVTDASGEYTFFYDARGNLVEERKRAKDVNDALFPLPGFVTKYGYDAADRLKSITYPSGRTVSYRRDAAGRIQEVLGGDGNGVASILANDLQYEPFGMAKHAVLGNGVVLQHEYDLDGRVERINASSLLDLAYGYDTRSNIDTVTDAISPDRNQTLGYDELSRLISATGSYGTLGYAYNATGDRTSATTNGVTTNYSYRAGTHRLARADQSYTYNNRGLATVKGGLHFVYSGTSDQAFRVYRTFFGTQELADFRYNFKRQRILQRWWVQGTSQSQSVTLISHYDTQGNLIAETCPDGRVLAEYAYLDGKPLAYWGYPRPASGSWGDQAVNVCLSALKANDLKLETAGSPYNADPSTNLLLHFDTEEVAPPDATITTPDDGPAGLDATLGGSILPMLVPSPTVGFGKALKFDGVQRGAASDQRAEIPAAGNHALAGTERWSLDVKIVPQVLPPTLSQLYIIANRHPAGPGLLNDWQLAIARVSDSGVPDLDRMEFNFQYWGSNAAITGTSTVVTFGRTVWGAIKDRTVDIRITFDRSQTVPFVFYVDGVAVGSSLTAANAGSVDQALRLGSHRSLDRAWGGLIDELRIANVGGPDPTHLTDNVDLAPLQEYYYLNDHLGAPQKLVDRDGKVVWDAVYQPFGGVTAKTEQVINNLRLPGQYYDAQFSTGNAGEQWGLYYNWNRDYDPAIGRYLQSDPIGLEGGLSTYGYAGQNPLRFTDPEGLDYWIEGAVEGEGGYGAHQSVCVGKWSGKRKCISFGRMEKNCLFNCKGHVYYDRSKAGEIVPDNYVYTDRETDRKISRYFDSLAGTTLQYDVLGGLNCRVASQNIFNILTERYGGTAGPPPSAK